MEKLHIENAHLEYKKASNSVSSDCWGTVSAFASTDGGIIILGVTETNK
ncbi:ATP-binding protein [Lactiplantibacillus pentosus]|jgi:predicted HTH transcriptional regulator|nr:ATP-binding protein [Lactiplantibacillus pentosus]USJ86920.1 ATP-binding protein [Lactiplantibacillus pentosus]